MKLFRSSVCLFFTVCAFSSVPLAIASEPTARSPESQLKLIPQIDFKGGKVRDLLEFLREQGGGNIVAGPGVDDVPLPELKLRNVTLMAAVNAISVATGGVVRVDANRVGPGLGDIITLQTDPVHKPADAGSEVVFHIFVVPRIEPQDYDQELKSLTSSMYNSVEFYNKAQPGKPAVTAPKLELHRDTHMLLVAGSRDAMKIFAQVYAVWTGKANELDLEETKASAVKVTILGAVQKPGVYSVDDGSMAQLIGLAGGVTNQGSSRNIYVLSKDGSKITVDFKTNQAWSTLREGDVVTVPGSYY